MRRGATHAGCHSLTKDNNKGSKGKMGRRSIIALALVCFPVLLAILFANSPHLALKVPKVGFVLFAILTGQIPGYFDPAIFHLEDRWHRKNDVFVSTCTKCGTTWAMATMHHIRARGKPAPYEDLYTEVRWVDFVYYPGQPMDERINILTRYHDVYPFSIYKTHFGPPAFKLRDDSFYIVGVRNPLDAIASLKPFLRNHNPKFAKMWGGFPVEAGLPPSPNEDEMFEHMILKDIGSGRPMLDVLFTDLVRAWWPHRKHKNVLLVHYSDRLKDHRGEIDRMAKFVGVDLTPEELNAVADQVTFESMKKNSRKYDPSMIFDEFKSRGKVPKDLDGLIKDLVNVGGKRNAASELSPQFIDKIMKKLSQEFPPAVLEWLIKGGHKVPDVEL